ncbi:MAG: N-acetylglutaminylglutamine amidotransferase [Gammaproteobacteria bacterium]|nr:N-acetylglutaminylglutamine amidotransferase [Gammaproteobacteria bacterium]
MCGICGELRFDQAQPDGQVLARMLPLLARRGPDAEGRWQQGPVQLGQRRLAVIDLTARSNQPLVDTTLGLTIVFNGAIYNYPQLRAQFIAQGYQFQSDGDTEVIIKAYHTWGERCPEYLDGMFAFVIWDSHQQTLFVARDRLGIKPLYYTQSSRQFRFASNPQALLAAGEVDTQIDPIALHHQLSLHAVIPAPRTILQGIRKLSPGTSMTLSATGSISTRRYWELSALRPATPRSEAEWIELVLTQLRAAVHKRLVVADVPVGVLLSGGLDSSLLVALLVESGVEDLLTFSIGFEDQPEEKGSEFEYSDQVVARYPTRHHKFLIPNDQVLQRLPEAVRCMSEPMVAQDAVAFYLLSEQVSRVVKVVQSGQGADEVFGGYFWYPRMQQDQVGSDVDRFARHYFDRDHPEYLDAVTAAYRGEDHSRHSVAQLLASPRADTFIDRVLHMDVTTLIVDDPVKRVDNMTMAFGLEARVPFLDYRLVELAAQLPPQLKLASGGKHILKRIARGRVPDGVIDRPKGYFPVPALKYVREDFLGFVRAILDSAACKQRGLFNRRHVDMLLATPDQHFTRLQGSKVWHLALLEYWLQMNIDRTPSMV